MQFSLFLSSGLGSGHTNTGFLIAIAVLACILGAEIACICILVSKMLRARRAKYEKDRADEAESNRSSYHHSIGVLLLFGAIPQTFYIALSVLAALTALAAVVFVVLLIIFRACGYDFAALGWSREEQERRRREADKPAPELPREEPASVWAEQKDSDIGEEQRQEAYTAPDKVAQEEEEPFAAFTEKQVELEDEEEDLEEGEDRPEVTAASVNETSDSDAVAVAPLTQTSTVSAVHEEPVFADGTRPYKVVEKVVTETFKEVYKETPAPAAESSGRGTDAVMEKLADFLDYELQKRKESDRAEAEEKEKKKDSVQVFAASDMAGDEDETDDEEDEIEEEDDDLDEIEDGKREEDEDRDDEENDTDGDHFTGNERIIGFDEDTGCYIVAHYRKSFEAKLIQSRPNIKKYYSELKNALLSYKDNKSRISWAADSYSNGRTPIAKINVKTSILELYLALDPASLEDTVYHGHDVGHKKKYADTPFRYKIRSSRKFKWALELVQRVCEEHGLSPIDIEPVDYETLYPFDTTDNLVARKLIKEYIREEKPASTFELDPDHVPEVPEEDESVIPANANFSWEFDNEKMQEKEPEPEPVPEPDPEPEPEPEPIPEPEPQPQPEPAPAPAPSVVRETLKITEMRYTERYYADTKPTYEQVITTAEPIEATAIPAEDVTLEDVTFEEMPATETVKTFADADDAQAYEEEEPTAEEEVAEEVYEDEEPVFADEESVDPFDEDYGETEDNVENDEEAEAFEEEYAEEVPAEEEVVEVHPFRPSFYANRNYYEDTEPVAEEETEDAEETVFEEAYEEVEEAEEAEETEEETDSEPELAPATKKAVPPRNANVNPNVAVVDICAVEEHFPHGAVINLDTLKAKELVLPSATVLKIYASGSISKNFTVEANHFTLDAIKAITDANGDSIMVR